MKLLRLLPLLSAGMFLALIATLIAQENKSSSSSAAGPASQTAKSNAPSPLIRSTTNLVILDVVVTRDGHPVKGLQQDSFHIFEGGREQSIKTFEEHSPDSEGLQTGKPSALPPGTYSNVPEGAPGSAINVLLLDAANTPFADQAYARRQIIQYLKTVPSGTRIAVFTLASRLRLVQGFTTDSAVLLAALNQTTPVQSLMLNQTMPVPSATQQPPNIAAASPFVGIQTSAGTVNGIVESLRQFEEDEESYFLDRRVEITLGALKQLALYLGSLPGRKNVIWFSASFPLTLTPKSPLDAFQSMRSYADQVQEVSDLLAASRVAVYPVDARGLIGPTPAAAGSNGPAAVAFASSGMRTGTINPSAFPNTSQLSDRANAEFATMLQLAEGTGGVPFYNDNAVKKAISEAIENGSTYYTLAYSPEDKKFDGKFRKVQVKLSGHDYQLAYRRGYYADPLVAQSADASLKTEALALQPGAPPSAQIYFRARVLSEDEAASLNIKPHSGPAGLLVDKLQPPLTRYWIDYTADMRLVNAEQGSDGVYHSAIEFIVIAYDREGKVVNVNRRAFKLGMPPGVYDELSHTGYRVPVDIDLPSGDLWLRLAVHDLSADRVGSIEVPLKMAAKKTN